MRIKVYLAGGMRNDWRGDLINSCGKKLEFLSPKELGTFTKEEEWWTYDKLLMDVADMLFVNIEKGDWLPGGLIIEIGYMRGQGKRIILVNQRWCDGKKKENETREESDNRHLRCIESFADIVFRSFEKGKEYMIKLSC